MNDELELRIPIEHWSATDYAYLVNNNLGWVSDDGCFWVFENESDMLKFKKLTG